MRTRMPCTTVNIPLTFHSFASWEFQYVFVVERWKLNCRGNDTLSEQLQGLDRGSCSDLWLAQFLAHQVSGQMVMKLCSTFLPLATLILLCCKEGIDYELKLHMPYKYSLFFPDSISLSFWSYHNFNYLLCLHGYWERNWEESYWETLVRYIWIWSTLSQNFTSFYRGGGQVLLLISKFCILRFHISPQLNNLSFCSFQGGFY